MLGGLIDMKFATNPLPGMNPWLEAYWGDKAYENGRYGNDLDYSTIPDPPLKADEQAWIADYLKCKTQNGSA